MSDHLDRLGSALAGRYVIERELGTGGMATVYRAHDVRHDRTVAIKVLRPDLAASLGSERFLREIRIAAKLTHPHILPLHDSGQADGLLYFVMPYVEGESLRERLSREGPLPVGEVTRLLREVVDALAFAHKQGIVHRDIKPDNVMLTERHAMVTDFGVAKAVTEAATGQQVTSFGVAVGTPAYMAPEQAAADSATDHRADLYALGVMAYEMLTGRPPFEGKTSQTVMAAHVTSPPVPVTDHRPDTPAWLADAVMRCLEKDPADRWQSAVELREQLEAHATPPGVPTPMAGGTAVTAAALLRRSHPARVLGLFAVGAVAVLWLAYGVTLLLGLPTWVFGAAATLVGAGLPLALLTGRAERQRAWAHACGRHLSDERGLARWLTWRRAAAGGGVAFGALAFVAGGYMALRLLGIGPVGTLVASGVLQERERLVLAEFENNTADTALGEAVTELFRIDLTQSRAVTVLEPAQVVQVLARMARDPADPIVTGLAQEVAQREGIKAIVTGEILPVGSGYVVSAKLVAAGTGEVLWAGRESAADPAALIQAVDRLSASLRERIGESLRTIRADAPLAQVTTRSTTALRSYVQADRAINQGELRRAERMLEEAIAEDTNFAMAHRKLGILLLNQNIEPDRRQAAFTRAYQLRDRLTERERYLAEAAYYRYVQDDLQASVDAYRTLLEKYPTDRIALNNLAVNYTALGRQEEAAALQLRSIALGGAPAATYGNAIETLYALGRTDTARALLEDFDTQYPGNPQVLALRAAMAAATFDYATAAGHMRDLKATQRANPVFDAMASLELASYALIQGRLAESHRLLREGYDVQAQQGLGFIRQPWEVFDKEAEAAVALRLTGEPARALAALDRGVQSAAWRSQQPEDRPYLDYAMLYAEAGRPGPARALLAQYRAQPPSHKTRPEESRAALHVALGSIALAEGRPAEAMREYQAFRDSLPGCRVCGLTQLGRAYDVAGQPDSAVATYERYLTAPMLGRSGLDNMYLGPVLRRLAELNQQLGNRQKAIDYYDRFIELWSGADPEFQPQVADARARLAALVREG